MYATIAIKLLNQDSLNFDNITFNKPMEFIMNPLSVRGIEVTFPKGLVKEHPVKNASEEQSFP